MARIRTIKPGFWTDEKLAEVPRTARLTFAGLFSACADDLGRFRANPRVIRGAVYPLDDAVTATEIQAELEQLAAIGVIELYTVAGERYGRIVKWAKHQKIDKPSKSQLPDPPATAPDSSNPPRTFNEGSPNVHTGAERSGSGAGVGSGVGKRAEAERKGGSDPAGMPQAPHSDEGIGSGTAGTLARWLAHFYADADPGRRDQVREQLSVLYRGGEVRFRKTAVRAKDVDHLERKAAEMLDVSFVIAKRDSAMAVLLLKLQDTEKDASGRWPGEVLADEAKRAELLQDQHETARKKAIAAWRQANPEHLVLIEHDAVDGMTTPRTDIGYKAELTARVNAAIVERIAFPDFDAWLAQRMAS